MDAEPREKIMFGNKSLPTVNFQFAAKQPTTELALVLEQLRAAHCYRNTLCELELIRREDVQHTIQKPEPRLRPPPEQVRFRPLNLAHLRAL